jgi:hypothetical protein
MTTLLLYSNMSCLIWLTCYFVVVDMSLWVSCPFWLKCLLMLVNVLWHMSCIFLLNCLVMIDDMALSFLTKSFSIVGWHVITINMYFLNICLRTLMMWINKCHVCLTMLFTSFCPCGFVLIYLLTSCFIELSKC